MNNYNAIAKLYDLAAKYLDKALESTADPADVKANLELSIVALSARANLLNANVQLELSKINLETARLASQK